MPERRLNVTGQGCTRLPFVNTQFEKEYKDEYMKNEVEVVMAYASVVQVLRKVGVSKKHSRTSREQFIFSFMAVIDHNPSEEKRAQYGISKEGSKTIHTATAILDSHLPNRVKDNDLIVIDGDRYLVRSEDRDGTFLGISSEIVYVLEEATG